jgi:hypothetical protein
MYTELQGTVVFKSEAVAMAFTSDCKWQLISLMVDLPSVYEFSEYSRSNWIPNGPVKLVYGKVVQFHSELKNYDSTIEKFLELLPDIADDWMLETKYEECSCWTLYRKDYVEILVNGDNSRDMEYYGRRADAEYPEFDVFDLENLDNE